MRTVRVTLAVLQLGEVPGEPNADELHTVTLGQPGGPKGEIETDIKLTRAQCEGLGELVKVGDLVTLTIAPAGADAQPRRKR